MLANTGVILREDELVAKKDVELLQLKNFYEQKYKRSLKSDILLGLKKWIYRHFKVTFILMLVSLILGLLFFYLGIKNNSNPIYFILAGLCLLWIMVWAVIFEPTKSDVYLKNLDTINLILKSRKELSISGEYQEQSINKKLILVYDSLKSMNEGNLTKVREDLHKKGKTLDYKTVRKHLNTLIKSNLVGIKEIEYESSKRKQDSAKVYYIK